MAPAGNDSPSAPTLVLRSGTAVASVFPEIGGRLGQLDLGNGPVLRGPGAGLGWAQWGCYPMLPWTNRIPAGQFRLGDNLVQLPVNWPDGSAIHGLAASASWNVRSHTAQRAHLDIEIDEGPYRMVGSQRFALEPDRLDLTLAVTNHGDRPVPVGMGIHPWFGHGRVKLPAAQRWPGEPLPRGAPVPVAGPYDLRNGIVPTAMDACFTSLTATVAEAPGVELHWSGPITNVVVYSGEPGWVCVEPVTMVTNGFDLAAKGEPDHGVQMLAPGLSVQCGFRFQREQERSRSSSDR